MRKLHIIYLTFLSSYTHVLSSSLLNYYLAPVWVLYSKLFFWTQIEVKINHSDTEYPG